MDEGIYIPTWWSERAATLKGAPARLAWGIVSLPGVASERGWTGRLADVYAACGVDRGGGSSSKRCLAALIEAGLIERTPMGLRAKGCLETPKVAQSLSNVNNSLSNVTEKHSKVNNKPFEVTESLSTVIESLNKVTESLSKVNEKPIKNHPARHGLGVKDLPRTPDGRVMDDDYWLSEEGRAETRRREQKWRATMSMYEDDDVRPVQSSGVIERLSRTVGKK